MSSSTYTPPEVWTWDKANGGKYASVNRPTAGAQFEQVLPVGHVGEAVGAALPRG